MSNLDKWCDLVGLCKLPQEYSKNTFEVDADLIVWVDEELEKRLNLLKDIWCSVPHLHVYLTEAELRQLQRVVQGDE